MAIRVVVQVGERLVRQGLELVLGDEPDMTVVCAVADGQGLKHACRDERPDVAVLELDAHGWDPVRLASELRKHQRALPLVAIGDVDHARAGRAQRSGICAVVSRRSEVSRVVNAVRFAATRPSVRWLPMEPVIDLTEPSGCGICLTDRQIEVLCRIGAGLTTNDIARSLGISTKTVENHKRQIFQRLGVQNQAHAVAIAMRHGLIGSDVGLRTNASA